MKNFRIISFITFLILGIGGCETSEIIVPRHHSFVKFFGSTGNQFGVDLLQLPIEFEKDIIVLARGVALQQSGIIILRVDTTGNEVWKKEFFEDSNLLPVAMILDDNELIIIGNRGAALSQQIFVYKIDMQGNIVQSAILSIPDEMANNRLLVAQDIMEFENNSYVISGYSKTSENAANEFFSIRIEKNLNAYGDEWKKVIPYSDAGSTIFNRSTNRILPIGNAQIISLVTSDRPWSGAPNGSNIEMLLLNSSGEPNYDDTQVLFSGTDLNDELNSIAKVSNGYVFLGTSYQTNATSKVIVGRINENAANITNTFTLPNNRNLKAVDINQIQDARYVILADEKVSDDNTNLYMAEVDDVDGEIFWEYAYGGEDIDNAAALLIDISSIYIVGTLEINNQNKILLIKTNRSGNL